MKDGALIYSSPRRLSFNEKEIVKNQVDEWVSEGIVEPCSLEWASPVKSFQLLKKLYGVFKEEDTTDKFNLSGLIELRNKLEANSTSVIKFNSFKSITTLENSNDCGNLQEEIYAGKVDDNDN
ncbi:hypothetical protein ILUMI_24840 [Ignelater luminosus]|uniref:Uncharacterized protein n=1 Tax=Ignelater luminosus TaxID=2038154 RepID=A0A8K0G095_IGNLU|nr:hypothetical protein ILUMI_24840 [Ignelater luminosus]